MHQRKPHTNYKGERTALGEALFKARLDANMTQIMVATALDREARQPLSHWETGRNEPSIVDVVKLCRIYKITPNELLGFEE